jgi:hypothetical protein
MYMIIHTDSYIGSYIHSNQAAKATLSKGRSEIRKSRMYREAVSAKRVVEAGSPGA